MQLSTTLGEGLRNYWSQLSAFSSNARLFLLSNLLGGVVISIYSLLFNFYLLSLGYQQDFLGLIASLGQLTIFLAALPSWLGAGLGVGANDVRAYQAGIGAAALINLISMFPLFMLRDAPLSARHMTRRPLSGVRTDGRVLFKLMFPNLLIGMGAGLLIPFNNVFLRERFSVNDSEVGTIFSMIAIVSGLS